MDLMGREEGRNCLNPTRSKREAGGYVGPPITALEIRVGLITKAWSREELEKVINEEITLRLPERRTRTTPW